MCASEGGGELSFVGEGVMSERRDGKRRSVAGSGQSQRRERANTGYESKSRLDHEEGRSQRGAP